MPALIEVTMAGLVSSEITAYKETSKNYPQSRSFLRSQMKALQAHHKDKLYKPNDGKHVPSLG